MDDSMVSEAASASDSMFSLIGSLHLPTPSRLPENACCPNKDLMIVIMGDGLKEKMLLLNLEGNKKWETEAVSDGMDRNRIMSVAWSPDGLFIALAHDPPRVTIHSVQDGREQRSLVLPSLPEPSAALERLWWFPAPQPFQDAQIPDVFQRNGIVTGSALSVLRSLPLLDALANSSQQLTANELFAFQGLQAKLTRKLVVPEPIKNWSSLPSNPRLASIQPSGDDTSSQAQDESLGEGTASATSILVVSDSRRHTYSFLDGGFCLGAVSSGHQTHSVHILPNTHVLLTNQECFGSADSHCVTLIPAKSPLPLINLSTGRQLAELSSSLRELLWYMTRVVAGMQEAWFGVDGRPGARDISPKWLKALEERQRKHVTEQPSPIMDLMALLVTGVKSKGMEDFLANNDYTSERSLQKWESVIGDAICKLRDEAELQIVPACQRVHMLLEDIYGIAVMSGSQLPGLNPAAIMSCLELTDRTLAVSVWLASRARQEFPRMKHFISWLRYEGSKISTAEPPPVPALQHDVLEVSEYLTSGIDGQLFDVFFTGPPPRFAPSDLRHSVAKSDLATSMRDARIAMESPKTLLSAHEAPPYLTEPDCNLQAAIEQLVAACRAACAPVSNSVSSLSIDLPAPRSHEPVNVQANTAVTKDALHQHLVLWSSKSEHHGFVCFAKFVWNHNTAAESISGVLVDAVLCKIDHASLSDHDDDEVPMVEVLDIQFFDEHEVIIISKTRAGASCIARVQYQELPYARIDCGNIECREQIWSIAVTQLHPHVHTLSIIGTHPLQACGSGVSAVAVNGRPKRRFACVLDAQGLALEVYDLSVGDPEADSTEAAEAGAG